MTESQDGATVPAAREFADVIWEIGEKRCCDEVHVHYDCGHRMRVDVWVPALPKAHEYANHTADRRRFMQHTFFILTRDPGAPKVQITVPEGRCRHCGYGQRLTLLCGSIEMNVADTPEKDTQAGAIAFQLMRHLSPQARRLELVFSSHVFLAAMGQVCRFPDGIEPPPLQSNSAIGNSGLMPSEGPLPPHECSFRYSRKDIEDELSHEVVRYKGSALCVLLVAIVACFYFMITWSGAEWNIAAEIGNFTSKAVIDEGVANNPWLFSILTFVRQVTRGSSQATEKSTWWSWIMQPIGFVVTFVLVVVSWTLNFAFRIYNVCYTLIYGCVWCPCSWTIKVLTNFYNNPTAILYRLSRPALIDQVPFMRITNALISAFLLSILLVVLSSPQPLSLSLQSIWGELPSLGLAKGGDDSKRSLPRLFRRKDNGRPRGNQPAGKLPKDRSGGHAEKSESKITRADKDGRAPNRHSTQSACFVCQDRAANYMLEPCGHHVVCGDCAMELVEMASRGRPQGDNLGNHRLSEKSGGGCPSCGSVVKQAMRIFS